MAKGDFNKKYNEYLSTHNYRGLAELLRTTQYDSEEARQQAYLMADKYEEEADISDNLLANADDTHKQAYNFIANGPVKPLDDNTPIDKYSEWFSSGWNKMADENGVITIDLSAKGAFDDFLEGAGISVDKLSSYGITRGNNNVITFTTDNPYKMEIYKGLNNFVENRMYDTSAVNTAYAPSPIRSIFSSNTDEVRIGYQLMNGAVKEANYYYNDLMSQTTPYILQTVVTGYMGEDDKKLQQAFANGAMDLQTFKEARAILEEKYNRVLQTKSLSQYRVWTMNEDNNGSQLLQELTDNIVKSQMDAEINLAMADGRLHYSHASNGVAFGTMIVIDQKLDNKGNPMKEHPAYRFFVKDLFKSEAENSLRQDTQVDALLQYSKHQTYGHVYRAKDGGRIHDWNAAYDAAVYTDEFGNERVINKAEVLEIMDDDIITKRLIDYYQRANIKNNNGRLYTEEALQVYGNGEATREVLENNIKARALQVMAAKYGSPDSEYVKVKANKLAGVIMRHISEI